MNFNVVYAILTADMYDKYITSFSAQGQYTYTSNSTICVIYRIYVHLYTVLSTRNKL